jgi:hypothetical protein
MLPQLGGDRQLQHVVSGANVPLPAFVFSLLAMQ